MASPPNPDTGRGGTVTHSARATSAVSSRNCFLRLVHTSFTVCWSRPTCRKPYPDMHLGLGTHLAEGSMAREGRGTPWGHHGTEPPRPGDWPEPQGDRERSGIGRGGLRFGSQPWPRPRRPESVSASGLNSPTHSQVHCKRQPLLPGMASLWPLGEETPIPVSPLASSPSCLSTHLEGTPLSCKVAGWEDMGHSQRGGCWEKGVGARPPVGVAPLRSR